jgi:hypothetical protein
MDTTKTRKESTLFTAAGAAFLVLALLFLWRDLNLPREHLMLVATVTAGLGAVLGRPRRWPALAPAALLATTVGSGLWYLAAKPAALLPALVVGLAAAALAVLRGFPGPTPAAARAHALRWYTLGAALLASTWALYFHFLTMGVESVGRRLVPTLVWLALGLVLFVAGRLRASAAAHVGLGLVLIALTKAIAYDTTHLHGGLRVAVLAAAGALLLFGARGLRAGDAPARPAPAGKEVA